MRIESLRLKGFTGIKRGIGMDEISVSFQGITGLVAFDGQNGSGKTTLLDNLHPFPQLASRDGALYHHCFLRDSEKELCFTYSGHSYRTLLKIDCQSEKQEGYIWKDGTDPEHSVVNGKISEYSKYVRALFGSPELFFSSVFCAQNSKKLSDMTTGKLKELFAEFLRLDRYQEWENTAKECAAVMAGKIAQVDARIGALEEQTKNKDATEEQYRSIAQKAEFLKDDRTVIEHDLEGKRKQADALKETIAQNAGQLVRKADLQRTIDRMTIDLSGEKAAAEGEIESLKAKYREQTAEIEKVDAILKDKARIEGAAEEEKATTAHLETLHVDAERMTGEINKQREKVHVLEIALQELRQALKAQADNETARNLREEIAGIDRIIMEQERLLKDLDPQRDVDARTIMAKIDAAREKMTALDLKDPSCQSTTCSFIVAALAEKDQLPALEKALESREAALSARANEASAIIARHKKEGLDKVAEQTALIETISKSKAALEEQIRTAEHDFKNQQQILISTGELLSMTRQQIAKDRDAIGKLKELASRLPEVRIAEARRADLERQRAETAERGKEKREAWTNRENTLKLMMQSERDRLDAIRIDFQAEEKLDTVNTELGNIEKVRIPHVDRVIAEARDNMAKLQGDLSRLAEAEKEIETAREEKEKLAREVVEWTYLRTACSKTGLQALEIDGAAPLITGYANELLSMAFGPLFTVKFRTQDEEGREILDIVTIGEDGEEILLDNLSGGQRIWILMALRLAMTLLSKEKSGRVFETGFFDEMDGPLDPDNSLNFIGMYQAFMKVGGFKSLLFISHKPSCRNMADNVLAFEMGESPVWR